MLGEVVEGEEDVNVVIFFLGWWCGCSNLLLPPSLSLTHSLLRARKCVEKDSFACGSYGKSPLSPTGPTGTLAQAKF